MKKIGLAVLVLFLMIVFTGCAFNKASIARQNIDNAQTAIQKARAAGATPINSPELAEAERYYKLAEENYNHKPKLKISTYLHEKKMFREKAAEFAAIAEEKADLARKGLEKKPAIKPSPPAPDLGAEVQSLQSEVQQLKEMNAHLRDELIIYKEQNRILSKEKDEQEEPADKPDQPVLNAAAPAQSPPPPAVREVSEIQVKYLADQKEQVHLLLNAPFMPKLFVIDGDQPRLVLDFFDTLPGPKVQQLLDVNSNLIQRIRTWHHEGENPKLRIVFDLNAPLRYTVLKNPMQDQNVFVVELEPVKE